MSDSQNKDATILPACVTIGNFDGVHLGHQALIHRTAELGSQEDLEPVLVTFHPHPREVLGKCGAHTPLMCRERKFTLLRGLGVARIVEIPFTLQLAAKGAEEFVRQHLIPLGMRWLVIGHDFSLGKNREGQFRQLQELGHKWNFRVEQVNAMLKDGTPISSTRLREALASGNVAEAAALLGRYYSVCGQVTHGFGRGTGLGFPTANLAGYVELLPANGVYATFVACENCRYMAVTNIGHNPTFKGEHLSVESFLLDCDLNLYGKSMCIEFVDRLRAECVFATPEELAGQIKIDVAKARQILSNAAPGQR